MSTIWSMFAAMASGDMASEFLAKVNNLRASKGVGPLSSNGTLNNMAVGWSNHMASNGTLSHNPRLSSDAPAET